MMMMMVIINDDNYDYDDVNGDYDSSDDNMMI